MTQPDLLVLATRPAELVLVAGPNGSGKTTIAEAYIQPRFPLWPKLNACDASPNTQRVASSSPAGASNATWSITRSSTRRPF